MALSECLIVFNQYTDLEQVEQLIKSLDGARITILTSHGLFPSEQAVIDGPYVRFLNFTDLTDQELAAGADARAYAETHHWRPYVYLYTRMFKDRCRYHKNAMIFEKIGCNFSQVHVFCGLIDKYNLNISRDFWKQSGATLHVPARRPHYTLLKLIKDRIGYNVLIAKTYHYLSGLYYALKPHRFILIHDHDEHWYLSTAKRIQLKEGYPARSVALSPLIAMKRGRLAAPLHSSYYLMRLHPFIPRSKIVVIEDAFRPSVYPPYYYAQTFTGCQFIPRDAFDRALFEKVDDMVIVPKPGFMTFNRPSLPVQGKAGGIRTIILMLNHAVDATAEISRADTDLLIMAFVELARILNNHELIIRLHPTMDRLEAEGIGASDRIRRLIHKEALSNLSVSDVGLEEDWDRGDLFVSEYSLSAIDALQYGKLVLFVNLTNRQSYMADYRSLGITITDNTKEMFNFIAKMVSDPVTEYQVQRRAFLKYQRMLTGVMKETYCDIDENNECLSRNI